MKYPELREELIDYLNALSNKQYQLDCWVNKQYPRNIEHDEFDYAVHFLFDDTELSSNPWKHVGDFLLTDNEANLVKTVCDSITTILNIHGTRLTDEQYICCKEWSNVLESASKALSIMA